MNFDVSQLDKVLIDSEGNLRFPKDKKTALKRLSGYKGKGLGDIHDVRSYITSILKIYDEDQRQGIEEMLTRYLADGFKKNERENLLPLIHDLEFSREQVLVFLDLLDILAACEERGWIDQFRDRLSLLDNNGKGE